MTLTTLVLKSYTEDNTDKLRKEYEARIKAEIYEDWGIPCPNKNK
jgi:hypothetical protein